MSSLIQDVQQDFKEFWELPIRQGGTTYHKTNFDSVNAALIFERLTEDSDKDDLALVCPEDPTSTLLIIIESLLSLLKYDILNGSSQILSTIKPGDPVGLMQNRKMLPGIYTGPEEMNGATYHCVKTNDGVVTKIPPGRSKWRIQPYMAANLAGRKRSTVVFGEVLEDLIGLPPGGLMAFQRSKALLVTSEKGKIIEAVRGVTLGDDPIETIFPIADYADASNRHHIGKNALLREPILGLVSNTDIAVDIALSDPAVKLVIIDGASKIRTQYGSIERLNADSSPRKIICLLKSVDEEEVTTLAAMNIDSWIWKRTDFKLADENNHPSTGPQPFELHDRIMSNLSGTAPQTIDVVALPELDETVKNALGCIRTVSRSTPPSEEAGFLFRWSVSLINTLLQLPVTMREYETYIESLDPGSGLKLDKKIQAFEERLRNAYGFVIPSTYKDDCEKLIQCLRDIYRILGLKNPKAETLGMFLAKHEGEHLTIVCCRPEYAEACRKKYIADQKIKVITISEAGSLPEENVVITGWANRRLAAKLFLAPYKGLSYLLYGREAQSYSQVLRSHPSSPVSHTDTKLRAIHGSQEGPDTEVLPGNVNETDIEVLISSVNNKFGGPSYADQLQAYGTADMVLARRILFEDDSCSYLTDSQHIDKLERSNRTTRKSKLSDIYPGDELIFAESGRDMFEELLAIIQDSDKYKALFTQARIWHKALESYVEENHLNERDLVTQMALVGNRPDLVTIRSWINGSVISPSKEYLRAIAKVTRNVELNSKFDEIVEACTKLYALHIQTGRLLVRRIIKAAVQEDEDILNDETREKLDTYSQSARVVTVREIAPETVSVPLRALGKLLET